MDPFTSGTTLPIPDSFTAPLPPPLSPASSVRSVGEFVQTPKPLRSPRPNFVVLDQLSAQFQLTSLRTPMRTPVRTPKQSPASLDHEIAALNQNDHADPPETQPMSTFQGTLNLQSLQESFKRQMEQITLMFCGSPIVSRPASVKPPEVISKMPLLSLESYPESAQNQNSVKSALDVCPLSETESENDFMASCRFTTLKRMAAQEEMDFEMRHQDNQTHLPPKVQKMEYEEDSRLPALEERLEAFLLNQAKLPSDDDDDDFEEDQPMIQTARSQQTALDVFGNLVRGLVPRLLTPPPERQKVKKIIKPYVFQQQPKIIEPGNVPENFIVKYLKCHELLNCSRDDPRPYRTLRLRCTVWGCRFTLDNLEFLIKHMVNAHRVWPFQCALASCGRSYATLQSLHTHLHTYHRTIFTWICDHCRASFHDYQTLDLHTFLEHHQGVFSCTGCSFKAQHRAVVIEHFDRIHHERGEKRKEGRGRDRSMSPTEERRTDDYTRSTKRIRGSESRIQKTRFEVQDDRDHQRRRSCYESHVHGHQERHHLKARDHGHRRQVQGHQPPVHRELPHRETGHRQLKPRLEPHRPASGHRDSRFVQQQSSDGLPVQHQQPIPPAHNPRDPRLVHSRFHRPQPNHQQQTPFNQGPRPAFWDHRVLSHGQQPLPQLQQPRPYFLPQGQPPPPPPGFHPHPFPDPSPMFFHAGLQPPMVRPPPRLFFPTPNGTQNFPNL